MVNTTGTAFTASAVRMPSTGYFAGQKIRGSETSVMGGHYRGMVTVGYSGEHIPEAKRKHFLGLCSPQGFCSGGTVGSAGTSFRQGHCPHQGESIKYRNGGGDVFILLYSTVSLCDRVLEEKPTIQGCIPMVTSCVTVCVGKLAKRDSPVCHSSHS